MTAKTDISGTQQSFREKRNMLRHLYLSAIWTRLWWEMAEMSCHNCMPYSPGNLECVHQPDERVAVEDIRQCETVYKRLVKERGKLVENKKKL